MPENIEGSMAHRPLKAALRYFLRLTIAKKMLLGYLSLVVLLVVISILALYSLNQMQSINEHILEKDVPLINAADKMGEAVLAQELYARRYVILGTPELLKVFWDRSEEFDELLARVREIGKGRGYPVAKLATLHGEYNEILIEGLSARADGKEADLKDHDLRIKASQETIMGLLKTIMEEARRDQNEKTGETASIGALALRVAWVLCIVGLGLSVAAATLITRNIAGGIRELRRATEMISEGKFDYSPNIRNSDELGDLAVAFGAMAKRLERLEEMYLDASPLTRLPGGVAIENVLRKRIESGAPFAFCLMDMDNFKAYNDRYGYAKGNAIIQAMAVIAEKATTEHGGEGAFLGHVGGDDFVVITTPDRSEGVCKAVIEDFDRSIPGFYDLEDRERGTIEGKDRRGAVVTFPLATVSIAVVTNRRGGMDSHIRVGEVAAELKEYAKSLPGSLYVVDQRRYGSRGVPDEARESMDVTAGGNDVSQMGSV